jgi:hypothetical protein
MPGSAQPRAPSRCRRLGETASREGIWALLLPIVIVVAGIYTGKFPPFKAGAVAFVYALIVTTIIHRELNLQQGARGAGQRRPADGHADPDHRVHLRHQQADRRRSASRSR